LLPSKFIFGSMMASWMKIEFGRSFTRQSRSSFRMKSLVFLLILPYVLAFELPFGVSALFSSKATKNTTAIPSSSTPRIAIIGAGAGGSSAAFWISKAKERFGLDVQVDVYEAADYIGGRASQPILTTYNSLLDI
jgi:hypothetical protein